MHFGLADEFACHSCHRSQSTTLENEHFVYITKVVDYAVIEIIYRQLDRDPSRDLATPFERLLDQNVNWYW